MYEIKLYNLEENNYKTITTCNKLKEALKEAEKIGAVVSKNNKIVAMYNSDDKLVLRRNRNG